MKNYLKINKNLIIERLYQQSVINNLYENISTYGESISDVKFLIESEKSENEIKYIIADIVEDLNLSKKFLFTFSTGIGAFYGPVNNLLNSSGFSFSKEETILLIITAISFLLNEVDTKKLMSVITTKNMNRALDGVIELISNTEKIINNVAQKSIGVTYNLTDILGFTFLLVPTTRIIYDVINDYGLNVNNLKNLLSGIVLASATYGIKSVLKRIKNKLKD
jgi:hypothetical protein